MFSFRKPSIESIRRFLFDQKNRNFTYSAVGGTAGARPSGFVVDHTRNQLGNGQPVFDAARTAIKRWEHFQPGWVVTSSNDIPIERGQRLNDKYILRVFPSANAERLQQKNR